LGNLLKSLGLNHIHIIEREDPQLKSLVELSKSLRNVELVPVVSLLNGVISYRLSCKGEDYWAEFSRSVVRYLSDKDPSSAVISFLESSKCNRLFKEVKKARIIKLRNLGFIDELISNLSIYSRDLKRLWLLLANSLGSNKDSKTVVFAVKMFYYGWFASFNEWLSIPKEVPIPLDVRVAKATLNSGLLKVNNLKHPKLINRLISGTYRRMAINAWRLVSELSCIPQLNIDSVVWLSFNDDVINRVIAKLPGKYVPIALKLVKMFRGD